MTDTYHHIDPAHCPTETWNFRTGLCAGHEQPDAYALAAMRRSDPRAFRQLQAQVQTQLLDDRWAEADKADEARIGARLITSVFATIRTAPPFIACYPQTAATEANWSRNARHDRTRRDLADDNR